MKKTKINRGVVYSVFLTLSITLGLLSFQNCSDAEIGLIFQPTKLPPTSNDFCTSPPEIAEPYTKFLFIVDKSGSNNTTDPMGKRANNIQAFYDAN